jgi:hypothetical protein
MDYFETDKVADAKHIGIQGHSRYGKATIVTMAYDPRIAIAFVSSSGEGGAKLHRRNWGELIENVAAVNEYHWEKACLHPPSIAKTLPCSLGREFPRFG